MVFPFAMEKLRLPESSGKPTIILILAPYADLVALERANRSTDVIFASAIPIKRPTPT